MNKKPTTDRLHRASEGAASVSANLQTQIIKGLNAPAISKNTATVLSNLNLLNANQNRASSPTIQANGGRGTSSQYLGGADLRQSVGNMSRRATAMNFNQGDPTTGGMGMLLPTLNGNISKDTLTATAGGTIKPKSAATSKRRIIRDIPQQDNFTGGALSGGGGGISPTRDGPPNYLANTFQQMTRVNNINVPDNAINMAFEVRLKELHNARDSTLRLNPKVIETWINETLKDAEHLDIPGVVLKPEHKNPVSRYQIDRLSLTNAGVPSDQVDRIYRGLFVYSIGFYEMLQRCLHHAQNKYILLSSLWRVFAILLEYCCKSNYQMLISKLNEEHKSVIDQIEKDFNEHLQKMTESEKHLKDALDEMQKKKDELEKQKEEEEFLRKKLEEEFSKKVETHEEEVQLRLKFEQKLNNMHALHRDLQAKYQRALEDIYQLEESNTNVTKLASEQKAELIVLRSDKVENESKILYQGERIKQLIMESELKFRQANDLELKLNKSNAEIESKALEIKNLQKQVNEQRLRIEANQALIDGLTSEKNHLDLTLKESQDQRFQYFNKSERLQKLNEEIFAEMQEYKMQLVGVQEIKRDRDDRLDKLRTELEEITAKFDKLDREHTALKVNHEHITDEYKVLKIDYDSVSEKLRLSNKVRNEKEDQLNDKIKAVYQLNETMTDKEQIIEKLRKEVEKIMRRLQDLEIRNDKLEIQKGSIMKQSEIQRKQLLEKIENLNCVITQEKNTRETWIARYEKEQKNHISTNNELLNIKGMLQDTQLKLKNLEIVVDSVTKQRDMVKHNNTELQRQITELMTLKETAERELFSKTELLRTVEEHHLIYARKLQEDMKQLKLKKDWEIQGRLMEFEDVRSYTRKLFSDAETNRRERDVAIKEGAKEKELREKVDEQLADLTKNYDELTTRYAETSEKLKESMERGNELLMQSDDQKKIIDEQLRELNHLREKEEEMNRIQGQNFILQEKINVLEKHLEGGPDGSITRGDRSFMNRGIQVKPPKQKERDIQTDPMPQPVFQQQAQPQMIYTTTQASTNIHSSQSQKRPRIASAAVGSNPTIAFTGASQMLRDPSHGMTGSQAEFNMSEQQMAQATLLMNKGSASAFSQQELERQGIKSAAQQYMHVIPGGGPGQEVIEEEAENYGTAGQQYMEHNYSMQQPISSLHQQNSHHSQMNQMNQNSFHQQQQSAHNSIYNTQSRKNNSSGGHQSGSTPLNQMIPQPPTGLRFHQQASRQQTGSMYAPNEYIVSATPEGGVAYHEEQQLKKASKGPRDDIPGDPDVLRAAVYEKRINQGTIIQTTRPMSQHDQARGQPSAMQVHINQSSQLGYQTIQQQQPNQTVRILSQAEQQMKAEMQLFQKQAAMMNTASSQKLGATIASNTGKSTERPVTGKASIRNLIKVATARD